MSGLTLTLAVMLSTSQAYLHVSTQRGPVYGNLASPNRRVASRQETIVVSSVIAIYRPTTPLRFGESTGMYSRRMPRWPSTSMNAPLTTSFPLSERTHSTVDGTPVALASAINLAKAAGTSHFRFRKLPLQEVWPSHPRIVVDDLHVLRPTGRRRPLP